MVYGHSAGGHLAACMVATDWKALDADAPADLVPAGYAISGVFDLAPLLQLSHQRRTSSSTRPRRGACRRCIWPVPARPRARRGGRRRTNSSEFLRQSKTIADAWRQSKASRRATRRSPAPNHFTVLDPLTDPQQRDDATRRRARARRQFAVRFRTSSASANATVSAAPTTTTTTRTHLRAGSRARGARRQARRRWYRPSAPASAASSPRLGDEHDRGGEAVQAGDEILRHVGASGNRRRSRARTRRAAACRRRRRNSRRRTRPAAAAAGW